MNFCFDEFHVVLFSNFCSIFVLVLILGINRSV